MVGGNHSRLTKIKYPNNRYVRCEYNSGLDSKEKKRDAAH